MGTPFTLTQDNIEIQFATNHIGRYLSIFTSINHMNMELIKKCCAGHFLLTNLLLDTMKRTAEETGKECRIVIVGSAAHKKGYREGIRFDKINEKSGYSGFAAYGHSKLANTLHANELARRLKVYFAAKICFKSQYKLKKG